MKALVHYVCGYFHRAPLPEHIQPIREAAVDIDAVSADLPLKASEAGSLAWVFQRPVLYSFFECKFDIVKCMTKMSR